MTTDNAHEVSSIVPHSGKRWLWMVLIGLCVTGILLLYASTRIDEQFVWHHLVRDIGIALLVSALVTYSYEGYLRRRVDLEKLESVLRTVAGSSIPATVWHQIQLRLLARIVIRREMHLKLRIRRAKAVPNFCDLDYELTYQLVSLSREHKQDYVVEHVLDAHIATAEVPKPCFSAFAIGAKSYTIGPDRKVTPPDPQLTVTEDRLHYDARDLDAVTDAMANGVGVKVSVTRREARNAPGSYMLIMSELTDGVTIELEDVSLDLQISVLVWPEDFGAGPKPLAKGSSIAIKQVLLPGHTIELRIAASAPAVAA